MIGNIFFKRLSWYQAYFLIFSILTSIVLTMEIRPFHILAIIILPLYVFLAKLFFQNTINSSNAIFSAQIVIWSLVIRIIFIFIVAYILIYIRDFPFLNFKDDFVYNESAIAISNYWKKHGLFSINHSIRFSTGQYSGYPNLSAFFMYFLGESWIIPRIGNAILSSFTVLYFYKLASFTYSQITTRMITSILVFSPIFIIFSSLQVKDTALVFFLILALYYIIMILKYKTSFKNILILSIALIFILYFRTVLIFLLLLTTIIYYLIFNVLKSKIMNKRNIISFLGLTIAFVLFFKAWETLELNNYFGSRKNFWNERFIAKIGDDTRTVHHKSVMASNKLSKFMKTNLYSIGGIIAPIPLAVYLPQDSGKSINYTYIPSIVLLSLKPFFFLALFNAFKLRKNKSHIFLFIIFYIFYKLGLSTSMAILNVRQTLPAILCIYFLLPMAFYFPQKKIIIKLTILLGFIAIFLFSFVRLYIRSLV